MDKLKSSRIKSLNLGVYFLYGFALIVYFFIPKDMGAWNLMHYVLFFVVPLILSLALGFIMKDRQFIKGVVIGFLVPFIIFIIVVGSCFVLGALGGGH